MTPRKAVIILGILAVLVVVSWLLAGFMHEEDDQLQDVRRRGQHIPVGCLNPDCGHEQSDFRAHSTDMDWPKVCPKCSQKTLYRAQPCPQCFRDTPLCPDDSGRILCRKCGAWLNPPMPGDTGPGPASP